MKFLYLFAELSTRAQLVGCYPMESGHLSELGKESVKYAIHEHYHDPECCDIQLCLIIVDHLIEIGSNYDITLPTLDKYRTATNWDEIADELGW